MTAQEITEVVTALGDIVTVLGEADPADKAQIYAQLGLQLTYEPGAHRVIAEAKPPMIMYTRECPRADSTNTQTCCGGSISLCSADEFCPHRGGTVSRQDALIEAGYTYLLLRPQARRSAIT
jgi:hypothetical protein